MPLEFRLIALVALIAAAIAFASHEVDTHDAAIKAQIEAKNLAAQKVADDAVTHQQNMAALRYEDWKMAQQPRVVVVTKEIHDAIQAAPVWSSEPVPSGVLDAIAHSATGPAFAASEPASAVPVLPAASDNERGASGGLRSLSTSVRGLFGKAPSPH